MAQAPTQPGQPPHSRAPMTNTLSHQQPFTSPRQPQPRPGTQSTQAHESQQTRVQTQAPPTHVSLDTTLGSLVLSCKGTSQKYQQTAELTVHVKHLGLCWAYLKKSSKAKLLSLFSPNTGVTWLCHLVLHCFSSCLPDHSVHSYCMF